MLLMKAFFSRKRLKKRGVTLELKKDFAKVYYNSNQGSVMEGFKIDQSIRQLVKTRLHIIINCNINVSSASQW